MKLPRRVTQLSLAAIFILLGFANTLACSCGSVTPCQAAGYANAVFIAKATAEHHATRELPDWYDETKTVIQSVSVSTLQIDQVFFGVSDQAIELWGHNTTCDYSFEVGKTYLVFAHQNSDGKWSTSACSRTRLLAYAKEDLAYLRNSRNAAGSMLNGSVKRITYDREFRWSEQGFGGVSVYLISATNKYRAVTNAAGIFKLRNLVGGQYRVYTDPATNRSDADAYGDRPRSEWTVDIPNRGCSTLRFTASPAGGVSGRVWSGDNLVTRNLTVELVPVGIEGNAENIFSQNLGEDGEFRFDFIPPGRYYLGINISPGSSKYSTIPNTFYPGGLSRDTASVLEVRRDRQLSGYDIRLPDSVPLRTLGGVVLGSDGNPLANAIVNLQNTKTGDRDLVTTRSEREGKFSVQGIEGQTYELTAVLLNEKGVFNSTPVRVKVASTNVPVQLVISSPEK